MNGWVLFIVQLLHVNLPRQYKSMRCYPIFKNPTAPPQKFLTIIESILGKIVLEFWKLKRENSRTSNEHLVAYLWSGIAAGNLLRKRHPREIPVLQVSARVGDHKYDLPVGIGELPLRSKPEAGSLSACLARKWNGFVRFAAQSLHRGSSSFVYHSSY